MSNKKGIRFFYQVATDIFYYNGDDDELKQETVRTKEILKYCYYEAFKGYECNSESLNQYRDDFNKWSFELLNNDIMKIDYKKYYNHESAAVFIFGMRSSKVLKSIQIQNILFYEFYLFEMCNNGALMTLCKDYKNKTVESFGNDYSSYYPTLLACDYYSSIYPKKIGQSSLWGSLIRFERDFKEDGEIFEIDASDIDSKAHTKYKVINEKHYKCDKNKTKKKTIYEIIESDKPYTHNLARLKPFFTAFTRVNIGELCIQENILSDVIRIHTDNITLNKSHSFKHLKYYPIKEDKTTGTFLWKNVNKYPSYDKKTKSYTWKNEPYEDK